MPVLPAIDGVSPSRFQLPIGPWTTVLDALCACFPKVDRDTWTSRFLRGRIFDASGTPLPVNAPYRVGAEIRYYREVMDEARIDATETLLHVDADLIVVDKPHGLPVMPGGSYVADTLLARLVRRFGDIGIVPLHRLDRPTAGVVLFSANPATRSRYQALFRDRAIDKRYEAIAAPLPEMRFPMQRQSRLERGEPFFRMRETEGEPNAFTDIDVLARGDAAWRYALSPITGRKHQLRVHMAALGAPIANDTLYPVLRDAMPDDPQHPLKLLARSLDFIDPATGVQRRFESAQTLRF
ncbi:pseudouridine synthase [Lysobacter brunescens]|uniref:Pseudouridine synthase n=1 Tax=Lysobacter brunescens TaxID=262323 RepID=A0ABW2Y8P6_9GAMM